MEGSMMESIVKLRKYVYDVLTKSAAYAINDMIDDVERDVAELTDERDLLKRQWEAGVDFDQRLESCADKREDVTLFGVDYMAYPLDADGVPIHAGDMLDGYGKTIEVVELRYGRSGWVIVSRDGNAYADCAAFSHHHAPTVEDVLREFADDVWNRYCNGTTASDSGIRELEAEYAARLRLVGDE